jgi:hypothetical protein
VDLNLKPKVKSFRWRNVRPTMLTHVILESVSGTLVGFVLGWSWVANLSLGAPSLCPGTPVNPRKHPIADTHDPIAYALEQAVGPLHGRRQPRFESFATQTLTGLGAGGETKNGESSRSREQ